MKKYRVEKGFEDAKISIAIMNKVISKDTATDEDVEMLFNKFPGKFDHNFELVGEDPQPYPADAPNATWTVEQLKAFAKDKGIELGRGRKEAAILKKIKGE